MSIKVEWTPLGGVPDTLTLYWATAPFTTAALPTDKFVVTPSAASYTDTTVPVNTVRYYMLEAVKAGANTQYSQCMLYGNYPKTGPGPSTILRGDWVTGYFGVVPTADMITVSALRTALGATAMGTAVADTAVVGYHKFINDGKIVYIPTAPMTSIGTLTWTQIYNLGLVYGVDGPGSAPFPLIDSRWVPPITADVNQMKTVTIGTNQFIVRLPKASTNPTNVNTPNNTTGPRSEWWNTICNLTFSLANQTADGLYPYRWGDLALVHVAAATQHFNGNANNAISASTADQYMARSLTSNAQTGYVQWVPVLELVF